MWKQITRAMTFNCLIVIACVALSTPAEGDAFLSRKQEVVRESLAKMNQPVENARLLTAAEEANCLHDIQLQSNQDGAVLYLHITGTPEIKTSVWEEENRLILDLENTINLHSGRTLLPEVVSSLKGVRTSFYRLDPEADPMFASRIVVEMTDGYDYRIESREGMWAVAIPPEALGQLEPAAVVEEEEVQTLAVLTDPDEGSSLREELSVLLEARNADQKQLLTRLKEAEGVVANVAGFEMTPPVPTAKDFFQRADQLNASLAERVQEVSSALEQVQNGHEGLRGKMDTLQGMAEGAKGRLAQVRQSADGIEDSSVQKALSDIRAEAVGLTSNLAEIREGFESGLIGQSTGLEKDLSLLEAQMKRNREEMAAAEAVLEGRLGAMNQVHEARGRTESLREAVGSLNVPLFALAQDIPADDSGMGDWEGKVRDLASRQESLAGQIVRLMEDTEGIEAGLDSPTVDLARVLDELDQGTEEALQETRVPSEVEGVATQQIEARLMDVQSGIQETAAEFDSLEERIRQIQEAAIREEASAMELASEPQQESESILLAQADFTAAPEGPSGTFEAMAPRPGEPGSQVIPQLHLRNQDLTAVIDLLSRAGNMNILAGRAVTGQVTARLRNVTVWQALSTILRENGFGLKKEGNIYRVVPLELLGGSRIINLETQVFQIYNPEAQEIADVVSPFLSQDGNAQYLASSNIMIVSDVPENLVRIRSLVAQLDQPAEQVIIDVVIVDASVSDGSEFGVEWNLDAKFRESRDLQTLGFLTDLSGSQGLNAGTLSVGFIGDDADFSAILKAEVNNQKAQLLANPSIVVMNNATARIILAEEIPFQELRQTEAGGAISTTEFKEVGITLDVTPRIAGPDTVILEIQPKESTISGVSATGVPIEDKRELQTTVRLNDGETVVIGGLRNRRDTDAVFKVPLLGDIPLIAPLFRTVKLDREDTQLLVFLTCHIIHSKLAPPTKAQQVKYEELEKTPRIPDASRDLVENLRFRLKDQKPVWVRVPKDPLKRYDTHKIPPAAEAEE